MKKLSFFLLALCSATGSLQAQDLATIIHMSDKHKAAVNINDIDSITVANAADVAADIFITNESKWKGKRIGFLGNSITEFGEYVKAYQELTGCNAMNYGVSATHMAKIDASTSNAFETRYRSMPSTLDMVIVFGGTNDFGHSNTADFGEFSDGASNKYTFYAGLHRLFKGLWTRYRGKPVVIMTPIHHGTEIDTPEYKVNSDGTITEGVNAKTGKTFRQYVNAIKEVAAYYSFIVLDAYSYSGLSPMAEGTSRYYFRDGLHLNERGGERLARWMYPQLELVYDMFY